MTLAVMEHLVATEGDYVLTLLGTCRKWRELALTSSTLWTNLDITTRTKHPRSKAEFWIARSRKRIYTCRIGDHWEIDEDTFPWEHIVSLTLEGESVLRVREFLGRDGVVPRLESLDITLEDRPRVHSINPEFWVPLLLPDLRDFTFVGSTVTLVPFPTRLKRLRTLDFRLDGFQAGEHELMMQMLRVNEESLESVTVRSMIRLTPPPPGTPPPPAQDPILLQNLTSFNLVTDRAAPLLDIFRPVFEGIRIQSPNLQSLKLGWFCINFALVRIMDSCPLHNLTQLSLECVGVHAQALGRLFVLAPNLERIAVMESRLAQESVVELLADPDTLNIEQEEVESLGFAMSSPVPLPPLPQSYLEDLNAKDWDDETQQWVHYDRPLLCPKLKHLEIVFHTGVVGAPQVDDEMLMDLITRRLPDDPRKVPKLARKGSSSSPCRPKTPEVPWRRSRPERDGERPASLQSLTIRGCGFKSKKSDSLEWFVRNVPDFTYTK